MRFKYTEPKEPSVGDYRYITKFAWKPKVVYHKDTKVTVWLERYTEIERWNTPRIGNGWWALEKISTYIKPVV